MEDFKKAVKTCLNKYADFNGRAARPEFWWFFLFIVIVSALCGLLDQAIFGSSSDTGRPPRVLSGLFHLLTLLPMLAAAWRRMQDTGRAGWLVLLPMLLSFAFLVAALAGVVTFAAAESRLDDPSVLIAPATWLGGMGVVLLALAALLSWSVFRGET